MCRARRHRKRMKVWLVRDLEPLPTDSGTPRLMRAGMLANALSAHGHDTTWFTSSFSHYLKAQRSNHDQRLKAGENLTIQILRGPGYQRNVSLRRILHNRHFAAAFRRFATASRERPDVIVADLPTTEAAATAVAFGLEAGIPTVVSICDLWPDFFADFVPSAVRPLARLAIRPLDCQVRFATRNATALVGISPHYLAWGQAKGIGRDRRNDCVFPLGYRRVSPSKPEETKARLGRLGIPPDKHIVSFVGSWGATYDLDSVHETCRLLSRRRDLLFVLAGDAHSQPTLSNAFRNLPNVVLPGWIDARTIASLLDRTTIGLLPYVSNAPQGLPNKVFEYMAHGAYQLSSLGGEVAKLYAETGTGLALPDAAPAEFASAIETTMADPQTLRHRDHRISVFANLFDAEKIYTEMADYIAEVASRGLHHQMPYKSVASA